MAARCSSPRPTRDAVARRCLPGVATARPGRAPAQGPPRPEQLYQLVIEGLPADFPPLRTLDVTPQQPAHAADDLRRPRAGGGRGRADCSSASRLADADRAGRHRQDAARAPGRGRGRRRVPGRDVVRAARRRSPTRRSSRRRSRRRSGSSRGRPRSPRDALARGRSRTGRSCSSSTTSSRSWTRRRSSATCCAPAPTLADHRHEPRAAPRVGRAGVRGPGAADAGRPRAAEPHERERLPEPARRIDLESIAEYEAVRAVRRAGTRRPARLPARPTRNAADVLAICRPARRPAARDRAGRGPDRSSCRRTRSSAASRAGSLLPAAARRPARAPADAARRHRLELRPARARGPRRLLARLSVFAGGIDLGRRRGGVRAGDESARDVLDASARPRRPEPPPAARRPASRGSGSSRRSATSRANGSRRAARPTRSRRRHAPCVPRARAGGGARSSPATDQRAWLDRLEREHDNLRARDRPGPSPTATPSRAAARRRRSGASGRCAGTSRRASSGAWPCSLAMARRLTPTRPARTRDGAGCRGRARLLARRHRRRAGRSTKSRWRWRGHRATARRSPTRSTTRASATW